MTDKMREEFEDWYRTAWGDEPIKQIFRRDDRGQYFSHHLHECWVTWKASRETLTIALPCSKTMGVCSEYNRGIRESREIIKRAIESLGLKVKS